MLWLAKTPKLKHSITFLMWPLLSYNLKSSPAHKLSLTKAYT